MAARRLGANLGLLARSIGSQWRSCNINQHLLAVRELRAPRVALAILSGAAPGLAGAMMQDGPRNPLASPELLCVASGASFVVAVFTLFQVPVLLVLHPWAALAERMVQPRRRSASARLRSGRSAS